ncbi:MAG: FAD-dependent oxidoreductase [bacterium]|nr:FAD-dependent oxidoreductase [bacterium]
MEPHRIVVIGGGLAGWGVAQRLRSYARHGDASLTLVEERPCHEFPPLYYEVATGVRNGSVEEAADLAGGVCVDFRRLAHRTRQTGITVVRDRAAGVDRASRTVALRGGKIIPYDALVLALGSETAYYGIRGLRDHAVPLKSAGDALRIRKRICDLVERASRGSIERFHVVVGGGGATGVEFAAELATTCRSLVRRGLLRHDDIEIALVEGMSRLLVAFPEDASRMALQRLHRLGVRVLLDAFIKDASMDQVTVVPRPLREGEMRARLLCGFEGETCTLPADLTVWTGGIAPPPLARDAGFSVDRGGRVVVDRTGLVEGERCVFALGDCAAFPDRKGNPLPPLASHAVRQAPVVAENVMAALEGANRRDYRARTMPAILPIGGKCVLLAYRNRVTIGMHVWCFRSLVDLQYFTTAFGWMTGTAIWLRGLRAYMQND